MIFEYAVDPSLVAKWTDSRSYGQFVAAFGLGTHRILARFPKKWKQMVWESAAQANEFEKKRLLELIAVMTEVVSDRPQYSYDVDSPWKDNATIVGGQVPFYLILDAENWVNELSAQPSRWNAPRSRVVSRTALAMADAIRSMLICSKKLVLIDPYFTARASRFKAPMAEFVRTALTYRPKTLSVEIHTSASKEYAVSWSEFENDCKMQLPHILPAGQTLRIVRWLDRKPGESMHNRYVLTNIGGVNFANGLDVGNEGTTDDVSLLDRDNYRMRWEHFMGPAFAFDLENELTIVGTRLSS